MKKFFITLSILLIIGGLGFFCGWAQFGVPPDSLGLIRSKTHGIDTQLVVPGEFRWVWYKLIPTNAQTIVFRLGTVSHTLSTRNMLPSGDTFAAFAGIAEDFTWELNATISFSLKPEAIIPLVTAHNISSPEELAHIEQSIAGQIENFIMHRINTSQGFTQTMLENNDISALEQEIRAQFPDITHVSLWIHSARIPDFALYHQIRALHEEYIAMQRDFLSGDLRDRAQNRAEFYGSLAELELYGDLLSRFPILLDFLAMENGIR